MGTILSSHLLLFLPLHPLSLMIMIGDLKNLDHFFVDKKECAVFAINAERKNTVLARLEQFGVERGVTLIMHKKSKDFIPFCRKSVCTNVFLEIGAEGADVHGYAACIRLL